MLSYMLSCSEACRGAAFALRELQTSHATELGVHHHEALPEPTLLLGPLKLLHQTTLRPLCLRLALLGLSCSARRLLLSLCVCVCGGRPPPSCRAS